jgi:hypothetical protein
VERDADEPLRERIVAKEDFLYTEREAVEAAGTGRGNRP